MDCLSLGIVALIIGVIAGIHQNDEKRTAARRLASAKKVYERNLVLLKSSPSSADQRKRTLESGRYYSLLTRENKSVTIYDEMAINNDIFAACGGTAVYPDVASNTENGAEINLPEDDGISRLERLARLHEQGSLTNVEYAAAKATILGLNRPHQANASVEAEIRSQAANIRRAYRNLEGDDDATEEQRRILGELYTELERRLRGG